MPGNGSPEVVLMVLVLRRVRCRCAGGGTAVADWLPVANVLPPVALSVPFSPAWLRCAACFGAYGCGSPRHWLKDVV